MQKEIWGEAAHAHLHTINPDKAVYLWTILAFSRDFIFMNLIAFLVCINLSSAYKY